MFTISRLDALLVLMAVIWGTNFTIVKTAFQDMDPQAFNAARMIVASAAFLTVIGALHLTSAPRSGRPAGEAEPAAIASIFHTHAALTASDWRALIVLGLVGHVGYQYFFIGGLARTSVANSSVILAASPVVIAVMSAVGGQERLGALHWTGAAVSALGIYLVLGQGFGIGGAGLTGDLMTLAAVCCWAVYSLGARPLMTRHSPVGITGVSMAIGTLVYAAMMWPNMRAVAWGAVRPWTLVLMVYSALFALCIAYTIWYLAVRQIGSARTAAYSNLVPLVAMAAAVVFLAEPLGARKLLGAVAVLAGVALTRVGGSRIPIPAEE